MERIFLRLCHKYVQMAMTANWANKNTVPATMIPASDRLNKLIFRKCKNDLAAPGYPVEWYFDTRERHRRVSARACTYQDR